MLPNHLSSDICIIVTPFLVFPLAKNWSNVWWCVPVLNVKWVFSLITKVKLFQYNSNMMCVSKWDCNSPNNRELLLSYFPMILEVLILNNLTISYCPYIILLSDYVLLNKNIFLLQSPAPPASAWQMSYRRWPVAISCEQFT